MISRRDCLPFCPFHSRTAAAAVTFRLGNRANCPCPPDAGKRFPRAA
jgi:hypothetical protein